MMMNTYGAANACVQIICIDSCCEIAFYAREVVRGIVREVAREVAREVVREITREVARIGTA